MSDALILLTAFAAVMCALLCVWHFTYGLSGWVAHVTIDWAVRGVLLASMLILRPFAKGFAQAYIALSKAEERCRIDRAYRDAVQEEI